MDHGEGEVKKFHSAGAVVRAMVDKSSQTDAQNGSNRRSGLNRAEGALSSDGALRKKSFGAMRRPFDRKPNL